MDMPNVTMVQKLVGAVVSVVAAGLPLLVAFGVGLTAVQMAAILGFVGTLGSAFVVADAVIRNGRSRAFLSPEVMRDLERPASAVINEIES